MVEILVLQPRYKSSTVSMIVLKCCISTIYRHYAACPYVELKHQIDGWMACDFRLFSTVFQSYQDDGQVMTEKISASVEARTRDC